MPFVSAEEAGRAIREDALRRNHKIIQSAIPPSLEAMVRAGKLKPLRIFNVGDKRWPMRPGGNSYYTIDACPEGERHSPPTIIPFLPTYGVAVDMDKIEIRYEDCRAVAEDVLGIGPHRSRSDNLTRFGCFIAAGDYPIQAELTNAHAHWEAWDMELIKLGDQYALNNQMNDINLDMRKACQRRHVARDWAKAQRPGQVCPGCGEMIANGVIMHGGRYGCGYIFDVEEARKRGMMPQPAVEAPEAPEVEGGE